jgi:hypothetical protein
MVARVRLSQASLFRLRTLNKAGDPLKLVYVPCDAGGYAHVLNINMVKQDAHHAVVRTVDLVHHDLPVGQVEISMANGYLIQIYRRLLHQ